MPGIGIGIGLPFNKVKGINTTNLTGRYTQSAEGEALVDSLGGVSIPYVSGSGLDQIFDFSVLNDARFDKSSVLYWGDTKDAWFYYDSNNPYHFKLKDFHYRYLNNQLESEYDFIFAKLKYTNKTLVSVDELLIYYNQQVNNDRTKLLKYIGIKDWNNKGGYYYYANEINETTDLIKELLGTTNPTLFWGDATFSNIDKNGFKAQKVYNAASGSYLYMEQTNAAKQSIVDKNAGFKFNYTENDYYLLNGVNLVGNFTMFFTIMNKRSAATIYYPIGFNATSKGIFVEQSTTSDYWGWSGTTVKTTGQNLTEFDYYKLAIVRNGTNLYFYQNGVLVAQTTETVYSINDLKIGIRGDLFAINWDGWLDNIVILNEAVDINKIGILNDLFKRDNFAVDYYFEDRHVSAQNNNSVLFCNDAGVMSLSLDGGTTIASSVNASADGLTICTFAHIFENGNIIFCSQRKAFKSTDGLQTYSEISVKDINGNNYTPLGDGVFRSIGTEKIKKNKREYAVWGAYVIEAETSYNDVNMWLCDDQVQQITSKYKAGVSTNLNERHIHTVRWNKWDNTLWIQTGDGDADDGLRQDCGWIKTTFNPSLQNWQWQVVVNDSGDETGTYVKSSDMYFTKEYMYWATDKTGATTVGIIRAKYDDLLNQSIYERLYIYQGSATIGNRNELVLSIGGDDKWVGATINGYEFKTFLCTGGAALSSGVKYLTNLRQKNKAGYLVSDQTLATSTYPNFTQGQVLMVKIVKTKV